MKKNCPDEIRSTVLTVLKLNCGNPVERDSLSALVGVSDRMCRKAIEELRREGEPIGQGPNGGYSYGDPVDVERTIKDYYARAYTNLEIARALQRKPIDGQVTIEDLMEF